VTRIPIDPDAIRALAALLTETGLLEIELAEKDTRIRVVRAGASANTLTQQASKPAMFPVTPAISPMAAANDPDAAHPGAVTSPMVGVAYLSAEPGAAPFVVAGQAVTAGQTVLLIEAMKTFNQIKATKSGTVTRILVQNSAPVEYGEVLMIVE
jgi:acetyl-CoA carboxylase biotin carboxyl carrier protein